MTRRRSPAVESQILSAQSTREAALAGKVSRARASQIRTGAGISTPAGRPPSPTSRDARAGLGRALVEIAERLKVDPSALLHRLTASVNAGCAMVDCDRAATHVDYTQHGEVMEALYTCEDCADSGAVELRGHDAATRA